MNIFTAYKKKFLPFFIPAILISISISGGDCEKVLVNPPPASNTLSHYDSLFLGEWDLFYQTGALQDICPDENVVFQSDNLAVLTCPDAESIQRQYSVDDNDSTLSYTSSSVYYYAQFSLSDQILALYGQNVSRNLFYQRNITDKNQKPKISKSPFKNSSEPDEK